MRVSCVSWRVTVKCSTVCVFDGASVGGSCALFCDEVAESCAFVLAFAAFVARVGENEAESGERGSVPAGEVPFAIAARGNPGAAKATHSANGARPWLNGGELVVFFIRDFAFLAHRSCPVAGKSPMACCSSLGKCFPLFFRDVYKKERKAALCECKVMTFLYGVQYLNVGYFSCLCCIYLRLCVFF